jgi:hypothetical protein
MRFFFYKRGVFVCCVCVCVRSVDAMTVCYFSYSFTRCMWQGLFLLPASVVSIYKERRNVMIVIVRRICKLARSNCLKFNERINHIYDTEMQYSPSISSCHGLIWTENVIWKWKKIDCIIVLIVHVYRNNLYKRENQSISHVSIDYFLAEHRVWMTRKEDQLYFFAELMSWSITFLPRKWCTSLTQ